MRFSAWIGLSAATGLIPFILAGAWMAATASSSAPKTIDLSLGMSGPVVIKAGMTARYKFTIKNKNTAYSGPVSLNLTIPASYKLTFSSYVTCNRRNEESLDCQVRNVSAEEATINMNFTVADTITCTNSGSLIARIWAPGDTNQKNNEVSRTLDYNCLSPDADLSISLTGAQSVRQGSKLTYTVKLKNNGLAAAENVRLKGSIAGSSLTTSTGSCVGGAANTVQSGDVRYPLTVVGCFFDEIPSLATKTFTLSMTAPTVRMGNTCHDKEITQAMNIVADPKWPAEQASYKTKMVCP